MGWLVREEYWRPESEILAEAALNIAPGAAFYLLSMGDDHIGFASTTLDTVPEGLSVRDMMVIDVPVLGDLQRTDVRSVALLSRTLSLQNFELVMVSGGSRFGARGQVTGDSVLTIELESAGNLQSVTVPLDGPILLPTLVPLRLAFGSPLSVGNSFSVETFDPLLMSPRTVEVRVTGDTTLIIPDSASFDSTSMKWIPARWDTLHAWHIEQRSGGLGTDAWIDELGRVVVSSSPVGFRMELTAFEIAYENFRRRGPEARAATAVSGDLIRQTAIASNVHFEQEGIGELRLRLGGVELRGFDLSGDRQDLSGDTLVIRRERPAEIRPNYRLPASATELSQYLHPEPLLQSDDPRVQAQARQIIGRTRSPRRAAQRLNTWVHETLEKEVAITLPSAVQVLETRRGDCNEHTVLYVALARAIGLPARTAAGLVYLDGNFYYHAWPEVYLDRWVAVDPTFGQFPADAAHVRFTIGGLARQVELLRLIGRLTLDVLEARS